MIIHNDEHKYKKTYFVIEKLETISYVPIYIKAMQNKFKLLQN